ncbi:MAG: class I adenylate-forming enzyme family protein [bacterium]|nr:class I adenylate-forming enzyme family protein [bacterium]
MAKNPIISSVGKFPRETLRAAMDVAVAQTSATKPFMKFNVQGAWHTRTYHETQTRIQRFSAWLKQAGVKARETRVALILPNMPEWCEIHLAICGMSAIVVHVDPKLTAAETEHILADAGASIAIITATHVPMMEAIKGKLPELKSLVMVGLPSKTPPSLPTVDFEAAIASIDDATATAHWADSTLEPAEDDTCALLYTSGTTGKPKGAMLSHRNFISDAIGTLDSIHQFCTPEDNFFVVLPLFHAFSFTANFLVAVCAQATLSFPRSLRTLTDDFINCQPTVFMCVPLMAAKLYGRLLSKIQKRFWSNLIFKCFPKIIGKSIREALGGKIRLMVVGGAKPDAYVMRGFNRMGLAMVEGYGLTECAPIVTLNPPHMLRIGSIGPTIQRLEARIANPNEQGVGELHVRGPMTFQGYWGNPEATAEAYDGKWLKTGDLAFMDKAGYITICGRAKALIVNREGKNIYPEEIEQVVKRHPLVGTVIALAFHEKDEEGEKVGLIVAPNEEYVRTTYPEATPEKIESILKAAVREQCADLAAYKHPRKVIVSHTPLELTSTQKVRRGVYAGTLDEK